MKNCPYCAEAIQDAAIVCKHCGRELTGVNVGAVTVRPQPSGWLRVFALVAVVSLIAIPGMVVLGFVAFQVMPSQNRRGECRLSGEAIVTRDAIAITNRDTASWVDAHIRIYGQVTSGPLKGPAGDHTLHRDVTPGVTTITLTDFQTAEGEGWIPMLMHVQGVDITATLRGEHCEVEVHKP